MSTSSMIASNVDRLILRAELRAGEREPIVCTAFELTPDSVFVVTERVAPVDSALAVRLSFPTLLEPVELQARVVEARPPGGPGDFAGLKLAFEAGDDARARLAALLELVRTAPPRPARTFRVLLVEDSVLVRDVFVHGASRFFQPPQALVIDHAPDAERAWEMLATGDPPDLVIIDYFLPEADGASLIARLRGCERTAGVPVVAISVGGPDARAATISAGADVFLDKPIVFRDLFSTLRILIQHGGAAARADTKTILVLDDSPLMLAIMRAALEAAGFEVLTAEDLAAFERRLAAVVPDLILVDVQMPEAFGDDVASALIGWHDVRSPILLVSSLDEAELARRATAARAAGYVWKGAGMPELVRRCKELLG